MTTEIHRKYKALPTLSMFHHDDSFYRGVRGPVRSGKSTGMCMEIFRRGMEQRPGADGIRRTRWAIVRNTYKELLDTTLKTWNMWFGYLNRDVSSEYPGCTWHKQDMTHFIKIVHPKAGPVEMEVMFRALDRPGDEAKLLSLEVTGAWVNEAREIPKGVIDTLGDRVGQFPAKMDGGCTYHGVMMDTNAPDDEHWWFKASEEDAPNGELPDWRFFTQPGALMEVDGKFVANPQAENIENLDEGMGYYFKRMQNKDYQYIKVYYCGEYGYSMEGMLVHPEFKPDKHRAKEVLAPIPGLPIVIGLDFGLCYDDKTEVLTYDGWKFFKDVDEKIDYMATRNPETATLEYTPINFKIAKPYKGKMLEWSNSTFNACVTPEHRVPFTFRDSPGSVKFASAEWLSENHSGHHYVDLCAEWKSTHGTALNYGPLGWPASVFAEFMGIWLSEGSVQYSPPTHRIAISQKENCPRIAKILEATGLKWIRGKGTWRTSNKELAEYLTQFGKAKEKFIPHEIRFMDKTYILDFISAYTHGDGHIRKRKNGAVEHTIFTTSYHIAGELQELALKVGWHSSVREVKPQISIIVEKNKFPFMRAIKSSGGHSITFKKRAKRGEFFKRSYSEIDYDGMIYCLNVPHHTLFVRRNGKVHWNGNTPAAVFGQRKPTGHWQIIDEICTQDLGTKRFGELFLLPKMQGEYGGFDFEVWGDPGAHRAETDETTSFEILQAMGIKANPAPTNNPLLRREALSAPINRGYEGIFGCIISPKCKNLISGLAKKYIYKEIKSSGGLKHHDKPDKNWHSHVCEAAEYMMLGAGEGKSLTSKPVTSKPRYPRMRQSSEHAWMGS